MTIVPKSGSISRRPPREPGKLHVNVVCTTPEATRNALREAGRLAGNLDAQICLIAAQTVPYPLPLGRPDVPVEFTLDWLVGLAGEVNQAVRIVVTLCRDRNQAVLEQIRPGELVVIGHTAGWWRSDSLRLGDWLGEQGISVVYAAH